MDVSVIICTRDRAGELAQTLRVIERNCRRDTYSVELIVVDNACADETAEVVMGFRSSWLNIRYVYEPRKGKCVCLNRALSEAKADIILFTDDDVVPANDWLEHMVTPLLRGECDAVVGRTVLAPHLHRAWMQPVHTHWLAAPSATPAGELELIGANMGIHRSVLRRVPAFDPELGPGALGFGEDSLFSWQLCEAGLRLLFVPDAIVEHHPDRKRLSRSEWLAASRARGRGEAYLLHHWHHGNLRNPAFRLCYVAGKLYLRRLLQPPPALADEGCPHWEMSYVETIEKCKAFLKEHKRARNYSKRGLVRLDAESPNRNQN